MSDQTSRRNSDLNEAINNSNQNIKHKMSFNQDNTCLSIGTNNGYRLYNLSRMPTNIDLLYKDEKTPTSNINRLFTSSLLAYSTISEPNKIYLSHFRKNQIICDYIYPSPVRSIQLNRNRLIIVLDDEIYIHAIKDMSLIHVIKDFSPILDEKCVNSVSLASPMSASALSNLIAYPIRAEATSGASDATTEEAISNGTTAKNLKNAQGQIAIFDAYLLRTIKIIDAHENKISATAFANNSSFRAGSQDNPLLLASASERGTVIRIWTIPQGTCIRELRRGMYHAEIIQLSFSLDAQFMGLISKNSTVHIWDLYEEDKTKEIENEKKEEERDDAFVSNAPTPQTTEIDDQELEKLQKEDENLSQTDNTWYSYLSSIANSMYNVTTSYLDATYNLTTGGVINRADYNCKIPVGYSAQTLAILKNHLILSTNENSVIVYDFSMRKVKNRGSVSDPDQSHQTEVDPGYGSIDCKQLNLFNLAEDTQTPILIHNPNSRIKSITDETNEENKKSSKSYSGVTKSKGKSAAKRGVKPMTRGTSKQIELDLRATHGK